jgi:hypothetical protein
MAEKVTLTESISESPISALSSVTALARFEFETGKGNEGTKVMMIEWQDDDLNGKAAGSWQVGWSGKTTVLPAENHNTTDSTKRLYFLLPPNTTVPPQITLSWQPSADTSGRSDKGQSMTLHTLPAIFTPELGATSKASGSKGVLHTIWAKSRLQVLEREIREEQALNTEGIALEMAFSERDWIVATFGLMPKAPTLDLSAVPKNILNGQLSPSLQSPRTPGGRRLSEKLKGLSLGTSEKDLARGPNTPTREFHPLSPDASDVAYSSFKSFRNGPKSPKAKSKKSAKTVTAQNPPDEVVKQQQQAASMPFGYVPRQNRPELEDDSLFAIALSPRTPDIEKTPFSFSSDEVAPYAKLKGERPT